MTPERWSQLKEIFAAVTDLPPSERTPALKQACGGDTELQVELEQLLAQHDEMGQFLEGPPSTSLAGQLASGNLVAQRYRIITLLGSGGMGEVYEAEDTELGEHVALKVVRPQMSLDHGVLDRFRREVLLARRVTHPNVCRVFDIGRHQQQDREVIFLTMELVHGETLSHRLKRTGRIAPDEALIIATQLCQALDAAHKAGILHRDFKCGNVMLIGEGESVRAIVADFGIARWLAPATDSQSTASLTVAAGTPAYMSPEQVQGRELTTASDIYSLGLVLYEMVTGKRPFHADSPLTEALKRLNEAPEAPIKVTSELSESWNYTILKCLEREPAKRFHSTPEIVECLRGETRPMGVAPMHQRYRLLGAAAAVLLAMLVLALVFRGRLFPPRLPQQKHVAVLPLAFTGSDPLDGATYGLAQSLTASLARLQPTESSLWVAPWSQARNRSASAPGNVAASLGVNLLITGSVEKSGDRFLVHADLKDAATFKNLRSRTVEVAQSERVTLEDKLFEQVAGMLQLTVPAGMLHHLPVDETVVPGAYEFYEQGRGYLLRYDKESIGRAIGLFQKAIEQDPKFALAYANLAYAFAWEFHSTQETKWRELAKENAAKAAALNERLASTHLALAMVARDSGNLEDAANEFQQALQLDPTDDETLNLLSLTYDDAGRTLQAESLLKDAVKRNSANWVNYNFLGSFYYRHAQYAQAEPFLRAAAELAPDNPSPLSNLGGVLLVQGRYKDAEGVLGRAVAARPTGIGYSNLGIAHFYQEQYKEAAQMFAKAAELRPMDDRLSRNLGDAYLLMGDPAKAAEAYGRAVQQAQKLLALRPADPQLLQNLALYYAKLGQKQNAQSTLGRAARYSSRDPEFIFTSGIIYELIGQRDRALSELQSALRSGYSFSEIQNAPELAQLRKDKRYAQIVGRPPN